jgi:hypothetical protein
MAGAPDPDTREITPAMIEAGETAILEAVGGADLGGTFSASDLAREVFAAMVAASSRALDRSEASSR